MVLTRRISKKIRQILDSSLEVNFLTDLIKQGRIMHEKYDTLANMWNDLKGIEKGLLHMRPKSYVDVRAEDSETCVFECQGGVIGQMIWDDIGYFGLSFYPYYSGNSNLDGMENKRYTYESSIVDFSFDVGLDLLAIAVESGNDYFEVFLNSLRTNTPHPLASSSQLHIEATDGDVGMQISANILVFYVTMRQKFVNGDVIVYDWKTNTEQLRITGRGFALLDDHRIAVLSCQSELTSIDVYNIEKGCTQPIASLLLPCLNYSDAGLRVSQPLVDPSTKVNHRFNRDPSHDIFAVEVTLNIPSDSALASDSFLIFFHSQKLSMLMQDEGITSLPRVEWNEWGPKLSRWMLGNPSDIDIYTTVWGSKTMWGCPDIDFFDNQPNLYDVAFEKTHLTLLDFNTRPVVAGDTAVSNDDIRKSIICEPWTYSIPCGNDEDIVEVTSCLPFRAWSRIESRNSGLMVCIEGDSIVDFTGTSIKVMNFT